MLESILTLKREGRFAEINRHVPYAGLVGLDAEVEHGTLFTVLRRRASNIGNTQIPAVHGGVVGALLEHAATLQLLWELDLEALPRIVDISVAYLRPCLDDEARARGAIVRQGRRIANVRVEAWQRERERPIATAHAHFLLADS